jgi:hypothetical protein
LTEPDDDVNSESTQPTEPDTPAATIQPAAAEESTVGTGSVFAIGCSILALLFVCVGVGIFMWRQVN